VNGNGDSVSVQKEPDGREIAEIKNGEIIYVEYSCFYDGDYWGIGFFNPPDRRGDYGWVKMDQLLVIYDFISFDEEHFKEFYTYNGDYDEIKKVGAAIAWTWPGSGTTFWTIENLDTENLLVSYAYLDKDGREWGFVNYLYGSRNIWICLSEPLNRDIPAFNPIPEPILWESETVHREIEKSANAMLWIIIVLVAILVIGTVVLIKIFWKPNKVKPEIEE
jgi:hypothetical protein